MVYRSRDESCGGHEAGWGKYTSHTYATGGTAAAAMIRNDVGICHQNPFLCYFPLQKI